MELRLSRGDADDHLTVFLFVAALLHGLLILGIRFTAPPKSDDPLPTLEVLLTPAGPNQEANLDASYIAERNQAGGGTTTDRVRTSLPEPTPELRDARGTGAEEGSAAEESRASLGGATTVSARALDASRALSGKEAVAGATARAPLNVQPVPEIAVGAVAAGSELALRGRPLDDDRLLADTRESQIAAYLDGWKRRIERVGTLNFPNEARRQSLSGNPVLEVAISANGSLQQVLVRRSSGYSELDHAAMNIVRLASPFDPFPSSMRDSYPVLRFAYEWQFIRGHLGSGAVLSEEP